MHFGSYKAICWDVQSDASIIIKQSKIANSKSDLMKENAQNPIPA